MTPLSTISTQKLLKQSRRGALLLALGAAGPGAWGQSFGRVSTYAAGSAPRGVALGDVNGDGRLDVVTANNGTENVGVLLGQTGGSFAAAILYSTGSFSNPQGVALGDARPTAAEVSLAPNPAHDAFTVQLPAVFGLAASAELLNALGQAVRRINVAGPRFTVETAGLAPGVYTLRLHSGGAALNKRVVVE